MVYSVDRGVINVEVVDFVYFLRNCGFYIVGFVFWGGLDKLVVS